MTKDLPPRKLEFVTKGETIFVNVDGKLINGVALSLSMITIAKRNKSFTDIVKETLLKRIRDRAADEGLRDNEQRTVITRFSKEIENA